MMKMIIKNIIGTLSQTPFVFKLLIKRWRLMVLLVIGSSLLLGVAYGLHNSMQTRPPKVSIDQQLLRERLFISVHQDSLEQLVISRGFEFTRPNLFRKRAIIGLPAEHELQAELDSLQNHYPDMLEREDEKLLCPTQKVGHIRYVSVPTVLMIRLNFINIVQ